MWVSKIQNLSEWWLPAGDRDGNRCRNDHLGLAKCSRRGAVLEKAFSSISECAAGSPLRRFRRRIVRNDGEDRRPAGSRSLGPTPAMDLAWFRGVLLQRPGRTGRVIVRQYAVGMRRRLVSWQTITGSRHFPTNRADQPQHKPAATAIAELTAPPQSSGP